MRRRVRRVPGLGGRVGNIYFVGEGWTPERMQRVLDSDLTKLRRMAKRNRATPAQKEAPQPKPGR